MSISPSKSRQSAATFQTCVRSSAIQHGGRPPPSSSSGKGFRKEITLNPHAQEFVPGKIVIGPESEDLDGSQWLSIQSAGSPKGQTSTGRSVSARDGPNSMHYNQYSNNDSMGSEGLSLSVKMAHSLHGRSSVTARQGQKEQPNRDEVILQASTASSSGRRGQMLNANHLLNFHYDPIPRHPLRNPPSRRQQRIQPYNKELFLQANFKFLVSDFGDYMLNSSNPDKMLKWDDVVAVNFSSSIPVQCPICLETPALCPQMTSCGHIFCFHCILCHLMMGEEDHKGDHWKKCPLCFATISCKGLRTVLIDSVKQYQVGDHADFTLLTRAKSSVLPFEKNQYILGALPYSKDGRCDAFSKFTLTSDVEQSANRATMELTSWAERVQSEGGEDLELLPYVYAAIDQLELRKKSWDEHRGLQFLTSSPQVKQRIMAQAESGLTKLPFQGSSRDSKSRVVKVDGFDSEVGMKANKNKSGGSVSETTTEAENLPNWKYEAAFSDDDESDDAKRPSVRPVKSRLDMLQSQAPKGFISDMNMSEPLDDWESFTELLDDEDNGLQKSQDVKTLEDSELHVYQEGKKELEDTESYSFYQLADGQPLILHPLNMKCLLHHYGSNGILPSRISGKILEMETVIQSESIRKHYRYLSHFPLTTTFQLCEIDLSEILPASVFLPFSDEIWNRENRRHWRMKQEQEERAKDERKAIAVAEVEAKANISEFTTVGTSILDEGLPSSLSFEEGLGGSSNASPSPPIFDERKLFSSVTRLGFAAGYDAPALNDSQTAELSLGSLASASSSTKTQTVGEPAEIGTGRALSMSFADIIMATPKSSEQEDGRQTSSAQNSGKRGKRASKILLSTAGGRRY